MLQLNSFSICLNSLWLPALKTDAHPLLIVDYCSRHRGRKAKPLPGKQANTVITAKHRQIVNMSISSKIVVTDLFISVCEGSFAMQMFTTAN